MIHIFYSPCIISARALTETSELFRVSQRGPYRGPLSILNYSKNVLTVVSVFRNFLSREAFNPSD